MSSNLFTAEDAEGTFRNSTDADIKGKTRFKIADYGYLQ
jgi:hypothetical protein